MKQLIIIGVVILFILSVIIVFISSMLKEKFWKEIKIGDELIANHISGVQVLEKVLKKHNNFILLDKSGWLEKHQFLHNLNKEYYFKEDFYAI